MRVVLSLVALTAAASPVAAQADGERSYEGTAGPAPIVLSLAAPDSGNHVSGRYFRRSDRRDIELEGERRGDALSFDAGTEGDRLDLRVHDDALVGTLTTAGKRLPVRLTRVTVAKEVPAEAPADLSLHEKLQLAGLRLEAGAVETIAGRRVRWFREAQSGVRLFRLETGYGSEPTVAINAALAQNQWRDVSASFGCTRVDGGPGMDGAVAGNPWLSDEYVSYRWRAGWDCGHASQHEVTVDGHSFDARTGRELTLDQVLPVGGGPVPPEGSERWYPYRRDVFAPAVTALLRRTHAAEMKPVAPEDDACPYDDPEVWAMPAWQLTREGLWLGARFPRAAGFCDNPEWSVLPWSALQARRTSGKGAGTRF
ncbi:hypothetical protein ACBY01_11585 [Sphingomonas sp. ac-8]|uniref:hypothetical protein n=1 Tax=Sphingomonas sp. ac-8 TaxID=3242977 RepID=UPI003A7F8141